MKATIEFNITEGEDSHDWETFQNMHKYRTACEELSNYLRAQIKHGDHDQKTCDELEKARAILYIHLEGAEV